MRRRGMASEMSTRREEAAEACVGFECRKFYEPLPVIVLVANEKNASITIAAA